MASSCGDFEKPLKIGEDEQLRRDADTLNCLRSCFKRLREVNSLSRVYRSFRFLWLCLPVLGFAPCASAQYPKPSLGPVPPAAASSAPSGGNRRVTLDVSVADDKGNPIPGLAEQDFTLLDDKKPVKLLSFQAFGTAQTPARPDEVIVVVDTINLEFRYVAYMRQELNKFYRMNEGRLGEPQVLYFVSDTGISGLPSPTTDGNALASALDNYQNSLRPINNSAGIYGADERFQMSFQRFLDIVNSLTAQPGRKLIVWIGPGWPMLGGPAFNSPPPKLARRYFDAVVHVSTVMRQNHIVLDSVSAGLPDPDTFYYESFLKGVKSPYQADSVNLGEKVIAVQSGGIVIPPDFNVSGHIAQCIDTASVYYQLSFDAPPTEKPDQYHSLEVKIDRHGLKAYTSTGYYDQP